MRLGGLDGGAAYDHDDGAFPDTAGREWEAIAIAPPRDASSRRTIAVPLLGGRGGDVDDPSGAGSGGGEERRGSEDALERERAETAAMLRPISRLTPR